MKQSVCCFGFFPQLIGDVVGLCRLFSFLRLPSLTLSLSSTDYSAGHGQVQFFLSDQQEVAANLHLSLRPSQQTPPGRHDPADAEPAVVPDQEVPWWAGLPQRRQAPLPEPVGEAARKHVVLRGRLLLRQDGPPPQSLGESAEEDEEKDESVVFAAISFLSNQSGRTQTVTLCQKHPSQFTDTPSQ